MWRLVGIGALAVIMLLVSGSTLAQSLGAVTLTPTGAIQVLVELSDPPAIRAYVIARDVLGLSEATAQRFAQAQVVRIEAAQQALLPYLTGPAVQAVILDRVQQTLNGILIEVDASNLDLIRQWPGVVSIQRLDLGSLAGPTPESALQ